MRALALGLALVALAFAGCSDSDDGGEGADADTATDTMGAGGGATAGGGGATASASATSTSAPAGEPRTATISVAATGAYPVNPAFTPSTASVPTGATVTVNFANEDPVPIVQHNWVVEGIPDAGSEALDSGEETSFTFTAPSQPGEFVFYCSIGDHRDRGMVGTLTVSA